MGHRFSTDIGSPPSRSFMLLPAGALTADLIAGGLPTSSVVSLSVEPADSPSGPAPAPASEPTDSPSNGKASTLGLIVGVVVGALVVLAVIALFTVPRILNRHNSLEDRDKVGAGFRVQVGTRCESLGQPGRHGLCSVLP